MRGPEQGGTGQERVKSVEAPVRRDFPSHGGEVGCLIRAKDWSRTPLGPVQEWPPALRHATSLMLQSPVPCAILWGEDAILLYNDGYSRIADMRHPEILGLPASQAWPEVAEWNRNVVSTVLAGETLSYRDLPLTLHRSGEAEDVWFDLDYSPILDEGGRAVGVFAVVVETTGKVKTERALAAQTALIEEANRRLSAESEFLQQLFEDAPSFMAMLVGPEHRFRLVNAAYRRLVGERDLIGRTVREALPEVEGQGFFELLDRISATGERHIGAGARVVLRRSPDAVPEERVIDFIYQPVLNAAGEPTGIFVEGQDVTARVRSEEHLRLVVGELNHRVKNSLTMVQAFTAQTFRNAESLSDAQARLSSRIAMLSRANDLLTATNWSGAALADVVASATHVHVEAEPRRLGAHGPAVQLGPRTAFSLSLALHELATNAAKHGAWSGERGTVEIRWHVVEAAAAPVLLIVWTESDGPPVQPPRTRGFGSRLLERGLASDMRARVEMRFEPGGLVCEIEAPLDHAATD